MDNATFEKMKAARENYHPIAMTIPGAHATSIGLKQIKGQLTDQFAIFVHVRKKRPASESPEGERIPREVGGFLTDVVEHSPPERLADYRKPRPIQGGCMISNATYWGTIGCIVYDTMDPNR